MRERWRPLLGIPYCAADLVRHRLIDMSERAFVPLARAFQIISVKPNVKALVLGHRRGSVTLLRPPPGSGYRFWKGSCSFRHMFPDLRDELRPRPRLPLPRPSGRPRD